MVEESDLMYDMRDKSSLHMWSKNLVRPQIVEKAVYEPGGPKEMFIVPLLKRRIEELLARYAIPIKSEEQVLDVGCGRQPFRKTLESIGYLYRGLDANQNIDGTVDFVCALDEPLPKELDEAGTFEFILCTEVMEHVADWDVAFRNLGSLVSSNGKVLITCPHFYQLHEEPYDFWRPTLHALRYFAERSGFEVIHQEAAGDAWDVIGTALANCYPLPVALDLKKRIIARIVRELRKWLFNLICEGNLRKLVKIEGPLYLSNIIVLESRYRSSIE